MKKFFGILVVAVFVLASFSACKKDYTCTCTYTDLQDDEQAVKLEIENAKKADAEDACDALKATWTIIDSSVKCELK